MMPPEQDEIRGKKLFLIFRTGLAYLSFAGLFAVFIAFLAIISLAVRDTSKRGTIARLGLSFLCRAFREICALLRVMRTRLKGLRKEKGNQLQAGILVANHPTIIDAIVVLSYFPDCVCVMKRELTRLPFVRFAGRTLEYVTNEDTGEFFRRCNLHLSHGRSVLIFPEGTRSSSGKVGRFTRGAAALAVRSGHPLVPLIVKCSPTALQKNQAWYDVPNGVIDLTITVCYPAELRNVVRDARDERTSTVAATRFLESFYSSQLGQSVSQLTAQD